jgi:SAM-dependent methyltransferase
MVAERLGLPAGWFDVVCCASAIYLLSDQAAAVRGWWAVLRPGEDASGLGVRRSGRTLGLEGRAAGALGPPLGPLGGGHLGPQELERMDPAALGAYRAAAFTAIEACREADGALHWRPEVVDAVASR